MMIRWLKAIKKTLLKEKGFYVVAWNAFISYS